MKIDKDTLSILIAALQYLRAIEGLPGLPDDVQAWVTDTGLACDDDDEQLDPKVFELLRGLIRLADSEVDVGHEVWSGRGTDREEMVAACFGPDSLAEASRYTDSGDEILEAVTFRRLIASRAQLQGSDPT